jgi:hypothetical protein
VIEVVGESFSVWVGLEGGSQCALRRTGPRRRHGSWCFHTSPDPASGSSSPVSSLIMVDLLAPLTPTQAKRDESETWIETLLSWAFSAPGYVGMMLLIFIMPCPWM